ncbi:ATP-binding cassette domain-containing protein [Granulicella aggregans]|uniref:ATP-binding cassette domain-containing protein n=1 Tax=Granulicella aggregans TaxID=474949 RepID=UPI0021DFEF14|nr:ATP-binding cassette domain-containing protein [Granulicella aggregans]
MPDPRPHLSCEIRHRLGTLNLDVAFELSQPWTVLFGPSGSGKSTILRAIAGLARPHHAKIALHHNGNAQTISDTSAGVFLPPHKRRVRWAAQHAALFPHMTVRENLRYATETRDADSDRAADLALERFHLKKFADSRPATLSGGEQQRVSVARAAIAANGRLLLLDEPFTGLDTPLRDALLTDLQEWLALSKTLVLSVTHDIAEAFQLNAEVLKLHEGRILQQGPAAEVLAEERLRLLAQLS